MPRSAPPGPPDPGTAEQSRSERTTATRRGVVLGGLMLGMGLVALDTTIVSTAIPAIVGQLGGFSAFGWLFSMYLLTQTVTIPICGRLSDVVGRRPILLAGVVVFIGGSVLAGAAWGMTALIAFRGVQGLGAGAVIATVSTVAGDLYSVRERGRVQGLLSSVWGVSAVVGPALGGVLSEYASWRWIFYLNLPVGAGCLLVISRYLHETPVGRSRRFDVAGSVLLAAGIGLGVLALMQGGVSWPWLSVPSLALFGLAATTLVGFAAQERRAAEPTLPPWLFRDRGLLGANSAMFAFGLVVVGLTVYLPTYAQGVLGASAVAAGFALATMSIGWPLASSVSARLYLRIGFRDTAAIGALFCIAAAFFLTLLPERVPLWVVAGASLVMGVGCGLNSAPLVVGVQSLVGWGARGVVTGASMSMRYLGQTVGAAVFAGVANSTLAGRLAEAPDNLRSEIPSTVDDASRSVSSGDELGGEAAEYLRGALYASAHHVFITLLAATVLLLVVLMVITPRGLGRTTA